MNSCSKPFITFCAGEFSTGVFFNDIPTCTALPFEYNLQLLPGAAGLAVHLALVGVRLPVGRAHGRELERAGLGAAARWRATLVQLTHFWIGAGHTRAGI